jgi:lysophospholipid acyltransferase (LPLAT)-like uncharacterized protein
MNFKIGRAPMPKPWTKRLKESLLLKLAPVSAALLLKALHSSLKIRSVGREIPAGIKSAGGQYIMAFWHGTLLLMVYAFVGKPEHLTFLVSWHRDGELITRIIKHFGPHPTRGSTTRGGIRALHGLLKKVKEGYDVAFTPDGPRGPAQKAQEGVIQTARLSGLPILPVGMAARRKSVMGSWDGFVVPWPFTRVVFAYGDPLLVPRELNAASVESYRARVEAAIEGAMKRAEAALEEEDLWRV